MDTKSDHKNSRQLTCGRHPIIGLTFAFLLLATINSIARINVVTLPSRDSVQLTIYNSVDLTLVKETRHLTRHLRRVETIVCSDPAILEALLIQPRIEVLQMRQALRRFIAGPQRLK